MIAHHATIELASKGDAEVHDVTERVRAQLQASGLEDGTLTVFVPGSTAAVTTLEYEPGVVTDLQACFDRLAPESGRYAHELAWHDGNGHSHVRAALLGPSVTVPVQAGEMLLGTWQQIVVVDFDNKPRQRRCLLTFVGI